MTHKDIYIKFMIEYDKANVTSSYPSLTEYEVATVLDKAYNALIAQKVTGNNFRRSTFESDVKAIADLLPLIVSQILHKVIVESYDPNTDSKRDDDLVKVLDFDGLISSSNADTYSLTEAKDFLYFLQCYISKPNRQIDSNGDLKLAYSYLKDAPIADSVTEESDQNLKENFVLPVKLLNHELANLFYNTGHNVPWVKDPVCYLENNSLIVVHDGYDKPTTDAIRLIYIKKPNLFVKSDEELNNIIHDISVLGNYTRVSYDQYYRKINVNSEELLRDWLTTYEPQAIYVRVVSLNKGNGWFGFKEAGNTYGKTGTALENEIDQICDEFTENGNEAYYYIPLSKLPQQTTFEDQIQDDNVYYMMGSSTDEYTVHNGGENIEGGVYMYHWLVGNTGKSNVWLGNDATYTGDAGQFSVTKYEEGSTSNDIIDITEEYPRYLFELNDTMAEELISLAIAFALENVESPRLNSRLNMRGLEA